MSVVLIVSKTKMKNNVCVGAIDEISGEFVRLHNERGENLPVNAPYKIGERWNVILRAKYDSEFPHVEDRNTTFLSLINNVGIEGIKKFLVSRNFGNRLCKGDLNNAFEGCLCFEGSTSYISRDKVSSFSTQFWIPDKDLPHFADGDKHYYFYGKSRIKFVGFQTCINKIPAGTVVRLSLARWWKRNENEPERCYLQLSGWYL